MGGKEVTHKVIQTVSRNLPTIFTGLTVAGVFTTAAMGIGATPKALTLLDEEICRRYEDVYDLDISQRLALLEKKK